MANPIASVDGAAITCPSSYKWELEDISAANAGRTEDTVMHKLRIGQIVKLNLEWQNVATAVAAEVLSKFNPEYVTVRYLDAMSGGYLTKVFYVGNRGAPLYNATLGLWSNVTFNLIERDGR